MTAASPPSGVDPLLADRLGFPKLRYVLVEHERRWLCPSVPAELVSETDALHDLYVAGSNLRLREARPVGGGRPMLRLTRKVEVDPSTRLISSIYLAEPEFALLSGVLVGRHLRKRRHRLRGVAHEGLAIDVFEGELAGLILLEAEFESPDAMRAFEPPWFAGAEVTADPRFTGGHLALHGLPPPVDRVPGQGART